MSIFKVFLISSAEPLELDLPASDICALAELTSRSRFIFGRAQTEDGGVQPVLVPTNRIHLIVEPVAGA